MCAAILTEIDQLEYTDLESVRSKAHVSKSQGCLWDRGNWVLPDRP